MGGGASSIALDDLLATTVAIGQAIAAISFPGMYRIYDFHSKRAPRLKSASIGMSMFSPMALEEDDPQDADPEVFSKFFSVKVGNDTIFLEDPTFVNDAGWTALHTCCMSFSTAAAGAALVEEYIRLDFTLDTRTNHGPGSFNREWTALHMCAAYGVEPLALKLLQNGADACSRNSYGYTPLLEACHRGFVNIVAMLLQFVGSDIDYIPPEELSMQSPFVSAPAQSALGEASRCGFPKIVQSLLDAGAMRDNANKLGWTALHEACFYNRIETVKTLLLGGANASIRTRSGALPYQLSGLAIVRSMLTDMGGPGAIPEEGQEIDMVKVLEELTLPDIGYGDDDDYGEDIEDDDAFFGEMGNIKSKIENERKSEEKLVTPKKSPKSGNVRLKDIPSESKDSPLLHSGPLLGDLPALGSGGKSSKNLNEAVDSALESDSFGLAGVNRELLLKKNRMKKKRGAKNKHRLSAAGGSTPHAIDTAGYPEEFLCELTMKPLSDPVESIYGSYFEKSAILGWMKEQGHVCPVTGAPLAENDIKPADDLRLKITKWILQRSMEQDVAPANGGSVTSTSVSVDESPGTKSSPTIKKIGTEDDLYDF